MGNVTIKQIAELAGVSVPAVSYVLNGKKGVSDETRERVQSIINDLNYTPNVNSRRLILQRSFNLLVCLDTSVSTLDNLFYTEVLNAIVSRAAQLGYNTVLSHDGVNERKDHLLETLSQRNADGIIFLRDIPSSLSQCIQQTGAPFVVLDSHKKEPPYPCIRTDLECSSYVATRHLIAHGHQKIAFIGMDRLPDFYVRSFGGYRRALSEENLPIQLDWIQSDAYDERSAQLCMERLLACQTLPTAVYCAGDIFAIGAMNLLQNRGYRIPEDFSVIGVDDIVLARYYHPALTTVHIDKQRMGALAVEMLDALISGQPTEQTAFIASDMLIERSTVGPPAVLPGG